MKTFRQFLLEAMRGPAIKGWMSPSGNAHLLSGEYDEHIHNHHPEYLKAGGKQGDPIEAAQQKGFVRFGANVNSMHGFHHFIHYDESHPEGRKTALKALRYLKPEHDEDVTLSGNPGVFKQGKNGKRIKNQKVIKQLGRDSVMSARKAYEVLRGNTEALVEPTELPDLRKYRNKLMGKEIVHPEHGKGVITWIGKEYGQMKSHETGKEHLVHPPVLRSNGLIK